MPVSHSGMRNHLRIQFNAFTVAGFAVSLWGCSSWSVPAALRVGHRLFDVMVSA